MERNDGGRRPQRGVLTQIFQVGSIHIFIMCADFTSYRHPLCIFQPLRVICVLVCVFQPASVFLSTCVQVGVLYIRQANYYKAKL